MENITENTKLADLLAEYPWLKEALPSINPKFKMLGTPMGKLMMGKATIADMSKKSGTDIAILIFRLKELIQQHSN
ncbi:MAG: DUF1858 domain-containing protein [Bacteroidales bacterium]|nr:DUF1858 domain-containing protein [Bacteroidales bacterium]